MKRRRKAVDLTVERCESRAMLSGAAAAISHVASQALVGPVSFIQLGGTIHGNYAQSLGIPDVGSSYALGGSGKVHGVGEAAAGGNLRSIGFIARGNASGSVVLAMKRGTITLALTGAQQTGGPQGLPENFTFAITSGTGKYKHAQDQGTARLILMPGQTTSASNVLAQGKFKLELRSYPEPAV